MRHLSAAIQEALKVARDAGYDFGNGERLGHALMFFVDFNLRALIPEIGRVEVWSIAKDTGATLKKFLDTIESDLERVGDADLLPLNWVSYLCLELTQIPADPSALAGFLAEAEIADSSEIRNRMGVLKDRLRVTLHQASDKPPLNREAITPQVREVKVDTRDLSPVSRWDVSYVLLVLVALTILIVFASSTAYDRASGYVQESLDYLASVSYSKVVDR